MIEIIGIVSTIAFSFVASKLRDFFKVKNVEIEFNELQYRSELITTKLKSFDVTINKELLNSTKDFSKKYRDVIENIEIILDLPEKIVYKSHLSEGIAPSDITIIKCALDKELTSILKKERLITTDIIVKVKLNQFLKSLKITFLKFILNAGLINSFLEKKLKVISREHNYENTIVGLLVERRIKSDTRSYIILFCALFLHFVFSLLPSYSINWLLILFLVSLIGLLHLNQKVLEFRIKKGYYGCNEYEAREILSYILEHSDKKQFNDKDGIKEIFPEAEITETKPIYIEGVVFA